MVWPSRNAISVEKLFVKLIVTLAIGTSVTLPSACMCKANTLILHYVMCGYETADMWEGHMQSPERRYCSTRKRSTTLKCHQLKRNLPCKAETIATLTVGESGELNKTKHY